MKKPLVSIITVVFNAGELLEKTIKSVASQTYPSIEYIVIDGNSTDNTTHHCIEKYRSYIHQLCIEQDKGLYDAMNKGLRLAKGDYVWFLHAGDTIPSSQTLEDALFNADDADLIFGDVRKVMPDGSLQNWYKKTPAILHWRSFRNGMVICHQSMLMKRKIAQEYDLEWKLAGDIDWSIRCLQKAITIRNSGVILCHFLAGGLSSKRKIASLQERFWILVRHFGWVETLWQHLLILLRLS